jgi:hypothetical protein
MTTRKLLYDKLLTKECIDVFIAGHFNFVATGKFLLRELLTRECIDVYIAG